MIERPTTCASRMLHHPGSRGRMARACLHGLQSALGMSGLAALYVRMRGVRGATLLAYHSVADAHEEPWVDPRYRIRARDFERQMRFLSQRRHVVSMTRLAEAMEDGADLPAGSVVITFDDGYLSNLTVAAPILL